MRLMTEQIQQAIDHLAESERLKQQKDLRRSIYEKELALQILHPLVESVYLTKSQLHIRKRIAKEEGAIEKLLRAAVEVEKIQEEKELAEKINRKFTLERFPVLIEEQRSGNHEPHADDELSSFKEEILAGDDAEAEDKLQEVEQALEDTCTMETSRLEDEEIANQQSFTNDHTILGLESAQTLLREVIVRPIKTPRFCEDPNNEKEAYGIQPTAVQPKPGKHGHHKKPPLREIKTNKSEGHLIPGRTKSSELILLYGAPDSGKRTLLRKAVRDIHGSLIVVNCAEIERYGDVLVRLVFKKANESLPCVLLIDGCDTSPLFVEETNFTKAIWDVLFAHALNSERVFTVLTSSRPWSLNQMVLERFETRIFVELPSISTRIDIFTKFFKEHPHSLTEQSIVSFATQKLEGFSMPFIRTLMTEFQQVIAKEAAEIQEEQRRLDEEADREEEKLREDFKKRVSKMKQAGGSGEHKSDDAQDLPVVKRKKAKAATGITVSLLETIKGELMAIEGLSSDVLEERDKLIENIADFRNVQKIIVI